MPEVVELRAKSSTCDARISSSASRSDIGRVATAMPCSASPRWSRKSNNSRVKSQYLHRTRGHLLPQLVPEEPPVPEQEHLRRQMAEQTGDHRWLAMGGGPHHHGDFDMGPQLDQAELANLREGASPRGPAEGRAKTAALASESGTSKIVPSSPINRKPP